MLITSSNASNLHRSHLQCSIWQFNINITVIRKITASLSHCWIRQASSIIKNNSLCKSAVWYIFACYLLHLSTMFKRLDDRAFLVVSSIFLLCGYGLSAPGKFHTRSTTSIDRTLPLLSSFFHELQAMKIIVWPVVYCLYQECSLNLCTNPNSLVNEP